MFAQLIGPQNRPWSLTSGFLMTLFLYIDWIQDNLLLCHVKQLHFSNV